MVLSRSDPAQASSNPAILRCATIRDILMREGLLGSPVAEDGGGFASTWRIAPAPFSLSPSDLRFFRSLGPRLLAFYRALNRLYQDSVRGAQPPWIAGYLDRGKSDSLVGFARMNRFKSLIPTVIRPDVLQTEEGMIITELDSVPGGIGLTGRLVRLYAEHADAGEQLVGGADGMVRGFARMLDHLAATKPGVAAIVVSDEAKDYRPEMHWLARELTRQGTETHCIEPREVRFTEEGLWFSTEGRERPIRLLYRFFELFDLKNIPKTELIMYSVKKDLVTVTPPFKPALEEKLAFALFHHPRLSSYWHRELGEETHSTLSSVLPRTWILDPAPVPPSAVIPNLTVGGEPVADWEAVAQAGQRDRQLVLKPSGFSELAWGSRGVSIGHDLPQDEWARAVRSALVSFDTSPHILQTFHKARSMRLDYYDPRSDHLVSMQGRARLCPYYFVVGEQVELGGILATVCPADKKILHGMRDAILAPCAVVDPEAQGAGAP